MYVLDTNVVSELRKGTNGAANSVVVAWAAAVPTSSLFISDLTLMELELGVLLKEKHDPAEGAAFRAWLDTQVRPAFAGRILQVGCRDYLAPEAARLRPRERHATWCRCSSAASVARAKSPTAC